MSDNRLVSAGAVGSEEVVEALGDIRTLLRIDGYELAVSVARSEIELTVTAHVGCGECLAPKAVVQAMIADALSRRGIDQRFTLRYPDSHVDEV